MDPLPPNQPPAGIPPNTPSSPLTPQPNPSSQQAVPNTSPQLPSVQNANSQPSIPTQEQNPSAAPPLNQQPLPPSPPEPNNTPPISIVSVLQDAVALFKAKIRKFILLNLLAFAAGIIVTLIALPFFLLVIFLKLSLLFLLPLVVVLLVLFIFITMWPGVAFLYLLGNDLRIKDALRQTFPKVLPMFGMTVLVEFIVFGGFGLFLIPGIILSVWFIFALIIYLYEGIGGFAALFKSKAYVKGYFWIVAFFVIGIQLAIYLFFFLTTWLTLRIHRTNTSFIGLFSMIITPFLMCLFFVLYQKMKAQKPSVAVTPSFLQKLLLLTIGIVGNIMGIIFLIFLSLVAMLVLFRISGTHMNDTAMLPLLHNKQQVFISRTYTQKEKPAPGDVIAFTIGDKLYIRRIIALPGETVTIRQGSLYINTIKQVDSHGMTTPGTFLSEGVTKTIPQHSYFVLGDNRLESLDSREFGFVKSSQIEGIVFTNPFDAINFYYISHRATSVKSPQLIVYPTPKPATTNVPSASLWQPTTSFPMKISREAAAAYNGYIYSIGGYATDTRQDITAVYKAPIHADGTLGEWTATTPLFEALEFQTAFVDNGYLFAIGGNHLSASDGIVETGRPDNYVLYAKINSDGSLGSWMVNATLPGYLYSAGVTTVNREIYVSPGCSCGSNANHLYHDHIYPDEKLSVWDTYAPAPVIFPKLFSFQNKLFAFGHTDADKIAGVANTKYDATIFSTLVNTDGTVGTWTKESSLPTPLLTDEKVLVDTNKNVFIRGTASNYVDFYASHFDAAGNLSAWKGIQTGMWNRKSTGLAIYNNYIYLIGGKYYNDDTISYNDVSFIRVNPDGSVSHP